MKKEQSKNYNVNKCEEKYRKKRTNVKDSFFKKNI